MNQREATVTLIDFAREHEPLDTRIAKAVKVLEKRAEVLRARHDRRFAPLPDDLEEEPLTLTEEEIRQDLAGTICRACGKKKEPRQSLCVRCYMRLNNPQTRKALWKWVHYAHAFCRALRELREMGIRNG